MSLRRETLRLDIGKVLDCPRNNENSLTARLQPNVTTNQKELKEIEKKYQEIKARSGYLKILGTEKKYKLSEIVEIERLGAGAFGVVVKARCEPMNFLMAVKRLSLYPEQKKTIMDIDVITRAHSCPYIVKCYGCFVTGCDVKICMELMTMGLDQLLKRNGKFPEKIVGKIALPAVYALKYLKEAAMVMHRDVKPSNILIDLSGTIKLCDFGISGRLLDTNHAATFTKGTAAYLAPERIGEKTDYGIKADVWSLGITLLELATGKHPFWQFDEIILLSAIRNGPPPRLTPSQSYTVEFCTFLEHCLQKNPNERPTYRCLLTKAFLTHAADDVDTDVGDWFQSILSSVKRK